MSNALGPGGQDAFRQRDASSTSTNTIVDDPNRAQLYAPIHQERPNPSYTSFQSTQTNFKPDSDAARFIGRTPSPTPSEAETLTRKGLYDFKAMLNWRYWVRKEWWLYYIIGIVLIVVIALISIYDKQIVRWFQPTAEKIKNLPAGWVIPIAIFFIISFPPLFGQEILAILVGLVWGLWVGFAITAAGTYLGEVGNFYAFKYLCRARGEKWEKTRLDYACLARIVRDGGLKVAIVARFSAIPGHFTTAIFSTCGMSFWVFSVAAVVSLPKHFVTVYIGSVLEQEGTGGQDTKNRIITYSVFAITTVVTILAFHYLGKKIDAVKHDVVYQRRKARQAKLQQQRGGTYPYSNPSAMESTSFNPRDSGSDLPLNPGETSQYQQWDNRGNAVGFSGDPRNSIRVVAPMPQRPVIADSLTNPMSGNMYSSPQNQYALPPGAAATYMLPSQAHQPPPPQFQPPRSPYSQVRQESVDSVSWDTSTQGAYRLPSIRQQSPMMNTNTYPPPLGPPPPPQQQEQLRHPPISDPFSSSTDLGGSAGGDVSAPPALPPPTQYAHYPPQPLTNPFAARGPSSEPGSPLTTPRAQDSGMFTSAVQRVASPTGPHSDLDRLPSPKFESFGQATGHSSGSGGGHEVEASVYYTPPHSRVATEDTAGAAPQTSPERILSPPPPSYRS
ncbi:hypothetical protein SCHPADRAFT_945770 [Schizopora paradoxa]|uniref:Golgi apparatus membrane protein TVP38 n=1 Tax=Schizopora paradoxa TaxID=27342 RepID=A0A0H2RBF5_9AGAM|nr:hypothetical protein SCHPADRAFT_945770 [Schizopora paradoxa]